MTGNTRFTPAASLALGGPDWLVERRRRAAEQLADVAWPTASEEIWRYSRIDDLDLDRYRPLTEAETRRGRRGERARWRRARGRGRRPRPGWSSCATAGSCTTRSTTTLAAKGVIVCGLATCEGEDVGRWLGQCSDASPDAFTVLHDAFLAGGAFVRVPAGVVVEKPIVVLHWSDGDGLASFPHTLVVAEEQSEVTVLDRFGSPGRRAPRRRRGRADRRRQRAREVPVGAGARPARPGRSRSSGRTSAGTRRCGRRRSRSAATTPGCAASRCSTGEGAESDLLAVYFGDQEQMLDFRTLQDHAAPRTRSDLLFKGAVEDKARSVYSGLIRLRHEAQKVERLPDQPQPRAQRGRRRGVDPEPRDRGRTTCAARTRRPSARSTTTSCYYLESRGIRPEDAERLIVLGFFEDVFARLPIPSLAGAAAPVGAREGRPPPWRLTSACARWPTSPAPSARRFDVDGHRLCVVHLADDWYVIGDECSHAD